MKHPNETSLSEEVRQNSTSRRRGLPRNVVALGFVSLFTDISSDMLYPIIPLFLTTTLGAPVAAVGLVEGAAEATAYLLRGVSGWLSDRFRRRKLFVVIGYAASALAKPLTALAGSWAFVLATRLLDRFGKSVRTSPRDALIAGAVAREQRGFAFGLHRAMDTTGAIGGALVALALVWYWQVSYKAMFVLACIPAALGVLICTAGVREVKPGQTGSRDRDDPAVPADRSWLTGAVKRFMLVSAVFALANSSNAFIILRAKSLGFSDVTALWGYVLFNTTSALFFVPAGVLSDKIGRKAVLLSGYIVYAAVYGALAVISSRGALWAIFAFYGLYDALTHGVSRAYISDLAPPFRRGTALGVINSIEGLGMLAASLVMGGLWQLFSAQVAFLFAAALAACAAGLLAALRIPPVRANVA